MKTRALSLAPVYRKVEPTPSSAQDFKLPFEGKLAATNRWVQLAELIPWSEFESEYAQNFVAEVEPRARIISAGVRSVNH